MFDHVRSDAKVQEKSNAIMCAIEKARGRALECGTSEPPGLEELDEDLSLTTIPPTRSLSGAAGRARIWDTGASKGMTNLPEQLEKRCQGHRRESQQALT